MNAFTDKRPFEISFYLNEWFSTCLPCRYQRVSEWWLVQLHGWVSQVRQHSWLLQVWMWSRLVLYWWKMQRYLIIFLEENFLEVGVCIGVSFYSLCFDTWQLNFELDSHIKLKYRKLNLLVVKRLTIRQALVATLVTTLIYRQGVDQIFFGGGKDYMIFRGYGRRSVVANRVYRGGHTNITQPYGRIRYQQKNHSPPGNK